MVSFQENHILNKILKNTLDVLLSFAFPIDLRICRAIYSNPIGFRSIGGSSIFLHLFFRLVVFLVLKITIF